MSLSVKSGDVFSLAKVLVSVPRVWMSGAREEGSFGADRKSVV